MHIVIFSLHKILTPLSCEMRNIGFVSTSHAAFSVITLLPDGLNSPTYLSFEWNILPGLLSATQASGQQQMWYMHDGGLPHFSVECV